MKNLNLDTWADSKETYATNNRSLVFENQPNGKRSLWTANEAAMFLGISVRTIRDLVYRRRVPYRKVGRCLRFDPNEIERWTLPREE